MLGAADFGGVSSLAALELCEERELEDERGAGPETLREEDVGRPGEGAPNPLPVPLPALEMRFRSVPGLREVVVGAPRPKEPWMEIEQRSRYGAERREALCLKA
jgi:hypothetical protein